MHMRIVARRFKLFFKESSDIWDNIFFHKDSDGVSHTVGILPSFLRKWKPIAQTSHYRTHWGQDQHIGGKDKLICEQGQLIGGQDLSLFGRVKTLVGTVNTLVGWVNTLVGRVNSLVGTVNTLVGRVNTLVGRVNTLVGRVNSLVGRVNSLVGRVNSWRYWDYCVWPMLLVKVFHESFHPRQDCRNKN